MFCVVLFCFAKGLAKAKCVVVDMSTLCNVLNMFLPQVVLCLALIIVVLSHLVESGVYGGVGCILVLKQVENTEIVESPV